MEEQDNKIKERFQKDKLISKKADDLFNNFLKEEINMNNEENKNNKVKKFSTWKKVLATAACFMVVLGGANIYASTQGYGNVFFLIRYLVTGEKVEIVDKDALLSDRDLVISYEPIQLTENIKIQIRRLLIKDNKATLSVVVREDEASEEDRNIVPLKYIVKNGNNETICEQESVKQLGIDNREYCDELELDALYVRDSILNLEIYRKDGQLLVKLLIDINNKTITVEGAEEAINKLSENDLKKFIGVVSTYPFLSNEDSSHDDMKVRLAFNMLKNYLDIDSINNISDKGEAYKVEDVNKVLNELGYGAISNNGQISNYKKEKHNGDDYYVFPYGIDDSLQPNTCIEISDISYSAGIYKVSFIYTTIPEKDSFEVTIDDMDVLSGKVLFKVNDTNQYSKYTIIDFVGMDDNSFDPLEPIIQQEIEEQENNSNTTVVNTINQDTATNSNTNTTKPNNLSNQNNSKIDNYASSLNWVGYWAPGMRLQYPDIMTKSVFSEMYRGSDIEKPDQVAVTFEGDLVGKDPDTQKKITSHTKITVYLPEYAKDMTEIDYYAKSSELILNDTIDFSTIPGGPAGLTSNKGINWSVHSIQKDGKYYELYTSYQSDVQFGYKVLFETDNIENYKVRNVINWFLGQIEYTSF